MKKLFVLAALVLIVGLFACTFEGTATFNIHNNSGYTMTAVKFNGANRPCSIESGSSFWIYNVDPGTYTIVASFTGHADYTIESSQVVEEGTVYIRTISAF